MRLSRTRVSSIDGCSGIVCALQSVLCHHESFGFTVKRHDLNNFKRKKYNWRVEFYYIEHVMNTYNKI